MDKKLYDLMDWEGIEAIVYSEEDHPGRILGAHKVKGGILVHTFLPDASSVQLKIKSSGKCYDMEEQYVLKVVYIMMCTTVLVHILLQ